MYRNAFIIGLLALILAGCNSTINNSASYDSANKSGSSNNKTVSSSAITPKAVMEKFIADAESGKIEEMSKAFSDAKLKIKGYKVTEDNRTFSDRVKEIGKKEKASIVNLQEKVTGETALVSFNYGSTKNGAATDAGLSCTEYKLVKEENEWRIDDLNPCP